LKKKIRKKSLFLIFWENILSECRLLMKLRGETKTWTHQKEWDHESELIVDFWIPAEFRCQVPLFPSWALPPQGQGLSHWIQLLAVSPYQTWLHIGGMGFFGESV
jgi:hypothetical protein